MDKALIICNRKNISIAVTKRHQLQNTIYNGDTLSPILKTKNNALITLMNEDETVNNQYNVLIEEFRKTVTDKIKLDEIPNVFKEILEQKFDKQEFKKLTEFILFDSIYYYTDYLLDDIKQQSKDESSLNNGIREYINSNILNCEDTTRKQELQGKLFKLISKEVSTEFPTLDVTVLDMLVGEIVKYYMTKHAALFNMIIIGYENGIPQVVEAKYSVLVDDINLTIEKTSLVEEELYIQTIGKPIILDTVLFGINHLTAKRLEHLNKSLLENEELDNYQRIKNLHYTLSKISNIEDLQEVAYKLLEIEVKASRFSLDVFTLDVCSENIHTSAITK